MADLVADLKRLRLYGMAACYAEGLEQGHPAMTTATAPLAQLVQAEATDRATRSIRYQMHVARFPMPFSCNPGSPTSFFISSLPAARSMFSPPTIPTSLPS